MVIVNFGCGAAPGGNCINVDGSLTVLLAKLPIPAKLFRGRAVFVTAIRDFNIRFTTARRLRFDSASLDAFYTSHTLEHLPRYDCENLLRRVRNWLKPDGLLRVVLPDLKRLARSYASGEVDGDTFLGQTHMSRARSRWGQFGLGYAEHRWMYDCESFGALLAQLGYQKIQPSSFATSDLPQLAALDVQERRDESFYIEARS